MESTPNTRLTAKERMSFRANEVLEPCEWSPVSDSGLEIREKGFIIDGNSYHLSQIRKISEPDNIHNRLQYKIAERHPDFQEDMYIWDTNDPNATDSEITKLAEANSMLNTIVAHCRSQEDD